MRRILATALAGGLMAAVACGGSTSSGSSTGGGTAKQGGTLRVAIGIDPDTLDPAAQTTTTSQQIIDMMAETLVTIDQQGAVKPQLAEKWDSAADGKSITFTLKSGVKFQDGTPLNAAAVKFSLERLCCDSKTFKPQPGILGGKNGIDHVDAVDDSHAKVVFKSPLAPGLAGLTQTVAAIVCPNSVNAAPNTPATIVEPCGTGPYKFKERVKGDHITLSRNESYWGAKGGYATQEYRIVPEQTSREAGVRSGQFDVAYLPPANDIPALQNDKSVTVILGPSDRSLFISLNTQSTTQPLLAKKEVRQALNYAVDKDAIVKNVMFGAAQVLDAPGTKSLFGYCSTGAYKYDPAKAKQLLSSAGATGMKVKLIAPTGRYVQDIQVAQAVAGYLRDAGVQVEGPGTMDWPSYLGTVNTPPPGKVDMHFLGWAPGYLDFSQQMQQFQSTAWPPAGLATSYYKNPQVDELAVKAASEVDQGQRKTDYCSAEKLVWDDAPWIFLYNQKNPIVTSAKVQNVYGLPNEKFVTTWAHPA